MTIYVVDFVRVFIFVQKKEALHPPRVNHMCKRYHRPFRIYYSEPRVDGLEKKKYQKGFCLSCFLKTFLDVFTLKKGFTFMEFPFDGPFKCSFGKSTITETIFGCIFSQPSVCLLKWGFLKKKKKKKKIHRWIHRFCELTSAVVTI